MPIIITYISGDREIVEGESWARLDQDSPRMGTIILKTVTGGHRIIVNKSAVAKVVEIPDAEWKEQQAEADKFRAEGEKAALEARKLRNRIRRLFKRG